MPHPERADVLIIGAGCAGLSLAARLAEHPHVGRVLVVDARTTFGRDRTWCFWDVHEHPFAPAVTHRWTRWQITGPDGTAIVRTSQRYAYQHVPADAFYASALAQIARAPHVELRVGHEVEHVREDPAGVDVRTTRGAFRATQVFDSRPTPDPLPGPRPVHAPGARLVQAFAGAVVRTHGPSFDPATCTLMDFSADSLDGAISFGYVLPYSAHEALVELAVIGPRAPTRVQLDGALAQYLARLGAHEIRSRESGRIPMSAAHVVRRPSPRVTRIGVAGGMAKPSTGYAFLAIQRDAAALAAHLAAAPHAVPSLNPPAPLPRGPVARWLDHVFLRRLQGDPGMAPALFTQLFATAEPDALVRFLSDVGSPGDIARVIAALPPLPFVAEVCRMLAA